MAIDRLVAIGNVTVECRPAESTVPAPHRTADPSRRAATSPCRRSNPRPRPYPPPDKTTSPPRSPHHHRSASTARRPTGPGHTPAPATSPAQGPRTTPVRVIETSRNTMTNLHALLSAANRSFDKTDSRCTAGHPASATSVRTPPHHWIRAEGFGLCLSPTVSSLSWQNGDHGPPERPERTTSLDAEGDPEAGRASLITGSVRTRR
jgi:hypothetical protein